MPQEEERERERAPPARPPKEQITAMQKYHQKSVCVRKWVKRRRAELMTTLLTARNSVKIVVARTRTGSLLLTIR